ncbi:MAG: transporter substrate-binding domain-containing protein, partial [Planctomycetota bacterium]
MATRDQQHSHANPRTAMSALSKNLPFIGLLLALAAIGQFAPAKAHAQNLQAAQDLEVAQAAPVATKAAAGPLKVGTKVAAPFAIKDDDGTWSGISIDLLRQVALKLDREFVISEFESPGAIVDAATRNEIDVGMAALSVTSEREQVSDFSHPYYQSGLKVAIPRKSGSEWMNLFRALTSGPFLATVGALALLLFATGAVMWLIERRHNSEHFPEDPIEGVGSGFWWSAVTMTTVGYGDKAPITFLGRAIAVVWMFAALILTA